MSGSSQHSFTLMIGSGSYFLSGAATEELEDDPAEGPEDGPTMKQEVLQKNWRELPLMVQHWFCAFLLPF